MTVHLENHADIEAFDVLDGRLSLDSRPVADIVAEVGQTPLYLYSASAIKRRVAALRQALQN